MKHSTRIRRTYASYIAGMFILFSMFTSVFGQDSCKCRVNVADTASADIRMSLIEVDSCWFADEETSMTCNQIITDTPADDLYEHIRVRGYWLLYLPGNSIYAHGDSPDTVIDVTWQSIDTVYSELRDSMSSLESQFGSYVLRKSSPMTDTGRFAGMYSLVFDSLVPPLSVDSVLRKITVISEIYMNLIPPQVAYVPNDPGMKPGVDYYDISTEDNLGDGNIVLPWGKYVHHTGWQWNLYRQKAPLAWEITLGKSSAGERTVLGFTDDWNNQFEHPDFSNNPSDSRYNFLEIRKSHFNMGDGALESVLFRDAHGETVAGMAVANMDNSFGITGICPDCIAVGYRVNVQHDGPREEPAIAFVQIEAVDVDGTKDGVLTLPSVVNISWGGLGWSLPDFGNEYQYILAKGIIIVGAAGNADKYFQGVVFPGSLVVPVDGADPLKDVEVITVGATRDGHLVNPDCTIRTQRNPNTPAVPSFFIGQERPMYAFNYPKTYDKWNTSTTNSGHDRRLAKEGAFMDIVAGTGWGLQCESEANGYYSPMAGTSQSTPQVTGTCGLMLSVNPNLGTTGYDIPRRAYNILTFTADKFDDDGVNIDRPGEPYPEFIQPSAAQDPLRRTWAPRLGYGRLNIYRAVAHSIPAKGVYEYTGSATIDDAVATSASSIAPHLIHFGAYRDGSTLVLDEGGLVLPYGRSAADLNQGKTLINGTGTVLTIDDNVVAAIDGILTTDNTTGNNRIVTADEGKVLMNGYVKDVSITGNMRLADVTIEASTSSITGRLSTGSEDAYVEAYENLIVRTCGEILVNGGRFRLMPGCHLNMLGVADIHVTSGGLLEMEFSSEVHGETGRKIVVESGSKLIVKSGAKVAIGVPVIVQSGGELVLEEDAIVDLAQFQIDQGGILTIEPGVHLALTEKVQNLCRGTFSSVGLSGQRIHITGRIETCCDILCSTVVQSATIFCRGYFGTTSEMGVFKMEYTDVSNVPITTSLVLKDPIIGCNFSADRSLVNFGMFLLTMDSRARITVVPKRWIPIVDATLTGCTFFDEAGDLSGTRSLQRYPINGINVIGHRNVTVVGSEFTNVRFGLFSQNCVKVKTVNQRVYRSNVGIYDVGSSVDECGSIDINVDYCTIPQGSQVGRQFNNRWQDTRWAYVPSGPSMQFLRGNEFRNFKVGVYAYNGTPVHLAPYGGMNYGRNMFAAGNVVPPATVPGSYFGAASPVDIHLLNGSLPFLECGRNQFGESTLYNLEKPETGNISINVSNNQWNDGISGYYVRRTTNITPVGSPLDQREDPPADCEETAAPSGCTNTSTHFPSCFDTTYFNHGNWNDLAPTDTFIVSAYTHIRAVVKDDTADAYCRRVGMSDMILLARLSDSASSITMLDTIMVDLMSIAADTSVANEVRTSAYFAMAGVYGVTGEQDSAISSCTAALQTSTGLMDSLRAKWSILAFTAAMDTTHGDAYDSLMSVHDNTVMTDLWNILTTGDTALPRRAVYGPTDATDAKGALGDDRSGLRFTDLTPNPANSSLKVRFWVRQPSEVRIDISTVHGEKTSSVFSGEVASGWHTLLVQTGEYVPGMYVCRIKSGEQVESKLIQIAR